MSSSNYSFNANASVFAVDGFNYYSPTAGALRLNEAATGGPYSINFNGTSLKTAVDVLAVGSGQVDPTQLSTGTGLTRYVSIPYAATSKPVTVTIDYSNSTTGAFSGGQVAGKAYGAAQVAIVTKAGQIVAVKSAVLISSDGTQALGDSQTLSATFTDPSNTEVFVIFNRSTDGTGGLRLWSATLSQ